MSQINDTGYKTFIAAAVMPQHARVKFDAGGQLILAVAGDNFIELGTLTRPVTAIGQAVSVALRSKAGTMKMIASQAIPGGSIVYPDAAGEITDVAVAGDEIGVALQTASAAGDVIEVLRHN